MPPTHPEKKFTKSKDKILIEMVRTNPVLYDNSAPHQERAAKLRIWDNIAAAIDVPVEQARRRWRHFRDHYLKKYREQEAGAAAVALAARRPWAYMERLNFLDCLVREKRPAAATPELASALEPESYVYVLPPGEDSSGSEDEPAAKRSRMDGTASGLLVSSAHGQPSRYTLPEAEVRSPTHVFFEAVADLVAQFPPSLVAEARLKVTQLVNELEARALAEVGCPKCRNT